MLRESCGVFGIYALGEEVARLAYFGNLAQQHRGQESSGIATSNGDQIKVETEAGRVDRFGEEQIVGLAGDQSQPAFIGIGHTRYSNTGANIKENFQPVVTDKGRFGIIALAHNGNLIDPLSLALKLRTNGFIPKGTSDSELIVLLIAAYTHKAESSQEAIVLALKELKGAYSLVILTEDSLIGIRDPWGIRPLCLGKFNGKDFVLASETCALEAIGATWIRDLEPGEMVTIDNSGLHAIQALPPLGRKLCIFEFIYFGSPGTILYDRLLQTARRHMGEFLWQEHSVEIDDPHDWVVGGVPDTGIPAAKGFAEASGLEVRDIFIKNRYIGRTFIQPGQRLRTIGVRAKLQALAREVLKKRVVAVEDSIVRATTTGQVVHLLFEAGAREVHLRISSPPYRFRCHMGIDTQYSSELIAARRSVEEIRQLVGANSLRYLSLEGVIAAINKEKFLEPISAENFCTACFTGEYPFEIPEGQDRNVLER